jgi:hypothetical protein
MADSSVVHLLFVATLSPRGYVRNKKAATIVVSRLFLLDTLGSVN